MPVDDNCFLSTLSSLQCQYWDWSQYRYSDWLLSKLLTIWVITEILGSWEGDERIVWGSLRRRNCCFLSCYFSFPPLLCSCVPRVHWVQSAALSPPDWRPGLTAGQTEAEDQSSLTSAVTPHCWTAAWPHMTLSSLQDITPESQGMLSWSEPRTLSSAVIFSTALPPICIFTWLSIIVSLSDCEHIHNNYV